MAQWYACEEVRLGPDMAQDMAHRLGQDIMAQWYACEDQGYA